MIKVRQSAVIYKPVSEVFRFVTDIDRFNLWVTGAVENKLTSSGDFGVGSTFDQIGEFMNKRLDLKIEVTRFDLDKVFGYRTDSGPVPFEMVYFFSPEGEDTKVTVVVVGENKGFLRMMGSVASAYYKVQLEHDLISLEKILTEQA